MPEVTCNSILYILAGMGVACVLISPLFPEGEKVHIDPEPLPVCLTVSVELRDIYPSRKIVTKARMYPNVTMYRNHRDNENAFVIKEWNNDCPNEVRTPAMGHHWCEDVTSGIEFDCDDADWKPDISRKWRLSSGRDILISGPREHLYLAASSFVSITAIVVMVPMYVEGKFGDAGYVAVFVLVGAFVIVSLGIGTIIQNIT